MTITDLPSLAAGDNVNAIIQAIEATGKAVNLPCIQDPELWFSYVVDEIQDAQAQCRTCPVRRPCLAGAVKQREPWGVWGGELFEDGKIVQTKSTSLRQLARAQRADELLETVQRLTRRSRGQTTISERDLRLSWNTVSTTQITDQHVSDALDDLTRRQELSVAVTDSENLMVSLTNVPPSVQPKDPLSLREMLTRAPQSRKTA